MELLVWKHNNGIRDSCFVINSHLLQLMERCSKQLSSPAAGSAGSTGSSYIFSAYFRSYLGSSLTSIHLVDATEVSQPC